MQVRIFPAPDTPERKNQDPYTFPDDLRHSPPHLPNLHAPARGMIDDHMSAREDTPGVRLLLVTAGVAVFMTSLDLSMVAVSLPSIARDLGISIGTASWVIMASLLVPCSFPGVFVRLGERKGFRPVFAAGCLVFAASSLLCGISENAGMLIGSRLLVGVGASMSVSLAAVMVIGNTDGQGLRRGPGIIAALAAFGFVLGQIFGSIITTLFSWHGIFFASLPLAIAGFLLALRVVPVETRPVRRELDYPGGFLIFSTVLGFTLFLSQGIVMGFTSPLVLTSLVVFILAFALFIPRERSTENPVFPPRRFRSKTFSLVNLAALLVMMAFAGALITLPFYLEYIQGLSPVATGLVLTIPALAMLISSLLSRVFSIRAGPRGLSAFSAVLLCFGFLFLARAGVTGGDAFLYGGLVLLGFGVGGFVPAGTVHVLSLFRPDERGSVSTMMLTIRNIGLILGVAVFSAVVVAVILTGAAPLPGLIADAPPSLLLDAFRVAFLTGSLMALLAFISVMVTRKSRGPVDENP
jgi:MFS family permease